MGPHALAALCEQHGLEQEVRVLETGVRWGYMTRNPSKLAGRNPQPSPRAVRAYTPAELEAIAAELQPAYRPLPASPRPRA